MLFVQRPVAMRMTTTAYCRASASMLVGRNFSTTSAGESTASSTPTTSSGPAKGKKQRLVVAVGGNALQRRGDRLTIENMLVCG